MKPIKVEITPDQMERDWHERERSKNPLMNLEPSNTRGLWVETIARKETSRAVCVVNGYIRTVHISRVIITDKEYLNL